jgi:hypothetical protein
MKRVIPAIAMLGVTMLAASDRAPEHDADAVIVIGHGASARTCLAAREVRRYIYLRCGVLLPFSEAPTPGNDSIEVRIDQDLGAQDYRIRTGGDSTRGRTLTLAGGSDLAVLYAAYDFAETLGVRFYLHGDVVPDQRIPFAIPELDETHAPLFETRGLLPFHDFTEGPDWWEADDYKACFHQMIKMRMNLIGLHCYPEGAAGPEPLVWIGHPDDVDPSGKVAFSPPSSWASTMGGRWGNGSVLTGEFAAGASRLFAEDKFASPVMRGNLPKPENPDACNEVYGRAADMLREAFGYGRTLGVRICIGTETPLIIPQSVQARLRGKGLDPDRQEVRQLVYEGMFTRIARAYPIDRYWLWTPETWTWRGAPQGEIDATARDIETALAAWRKTDSPFAFGTCGWELGPRQDRALFHNLLPAGAAMSCINRNIGFNWVDQEFANIKDRPKWAIPWLEDDSAMVLPQLWAGRLRRDAADALSYGCTGLLGIHWRTKVLAPNVSALAQSAWSQKGWNPDDGQPAGTPPPSPVNRKRDLPCDDFYTDLCAIWFGPEVAAEMAAFLTRHDGDGGATGVIQGRATLPRPNTWLYGPGAIVANRVPWAQASEAYAFVDELARLRRRVRGPGNLARFDYWLNNFRYLRALAEVACQRGALDVAMEQVKAGTDPGRKKELAVSLALPARERLARSWERMMTHLLSVTDTPGELGTIANLEQSSRRALQLVEGYDRELVETSGMPLPEATVVSLLYQGEPRIIVPSVRSMAVQGERSELKVIVLDNEKPAEALLFWRTMGEGEFRPLPLHPVARGVHKVKLPEVPAGGAEYFIRVRTAAGKPLVWPATAPTTGQTVVAMP